jgi:AraC family transcriptional activator of pobA
MPRPGPRTADTAPPLVEFHRRKYGRELLVDAAFVHEMPSFLTRSGPHALGFHDILLVTRGRGVFYKDGDPYRVLPGVVLFSRPGEVRDWRVRGLDGACLFFTEEFVTEAFADPLFLDRLSCFAADRPSASLRLSPARRRLVLERFAVMQREIAALRDDAPHALRAVLYEMLVLLSRWYTACHGGPRSERDGDLVARFLALVEKGFETRHTVAAYARELGVSPGHLSSACRSRLRRNASGVVHARVVLEAKRRLVYSRETAAEVALGLGFFDPAYFARFFRRETGESPSGFRARRRLDGATARRPTPRARRG